jgi:hypothetical protein
MAAPWGGKGHLLAQAPQFFTSLLTSVSQPLAPSLRQERMVPVHTGACEQSVPPAAADAAHIPLPVSLLQAANTKTLHSNTPKIAVFSHNLPPVSCPRNLWQSFVRSYHCIGERYNRRSALSIQQGSYRRWFVSGFKRY